MLKTIEPLRANCGQIGNNIYICAANQYRFKL